MGILKKIRMALQHFWDILIINELVQLIPSNSIRCFFYKASGMKIGKQTRIFRKCYLQQPDHIEIGNNCLIGFYCRLAGRGFLKIGNNVNISNNVILETGSHELTTFETIFRPINIEDNVWICTRATILQGVTIGEGAVVGAESLVNKNVEPYTIVAGIPAKKIGNRPREIKYRLSSSKGF